MSVLLIIKSLRYFPSKIYLRPIRRKSSLGLWQDDINTEIKQKIEEHWASEIYHRTCSHPNEKPQYVLPMFPYPSGNLHMGHVRVYSISDSIARFYRLNSHHVIQPIGWDAFGLPAENAAIQHNIAPDKWTQLNIESMKNQLLCLGFDFDWSREISTCDPKYYKWTQYLFLKLFEKGLAYQNKALVNWDPVDKTVLADEQVDEFGCSWRSGAKVEKKVLKQWFVKTTAFAKKLYEGLNSDSLRNWKDIINLQKHWIGECNGVAVTLKLKSDEKEKAIEVWSADPYKFIHGQFIVIHPKNVVLADVNSKNLKCINTLTGDSIPVYICENASFAEERDVYIACPKIDEEDITLAERLNHPTQANMSINIHIENKKAVDLALSKNLGGHYVSSKLKDWLISRQRYWGTPIPIIHCDKCGAVPVPYESLPIKLPIKNPTEHRLQSLAKLDDWIKCQCPRCRSDARRETDTMDTFVDSSWYFYRFLDPHNDNAVFDKQVVWNNMPVDIYIGGKEHAVLHLYYARFMSYFINSLGLSPTAEPFAKLVVQGMVMGQSFKVKSSGKYLPPEHVVKEGKKYKEIDTGEIVTTQWEKMSKSKFNGVNPERLLKNYGCDTTRLLILADVPPETSRNWSDATLPGILNWQHRLWLTMREFLKYRNNQVIGNSMSNEEFIKHEDKIREARNYFTATSTYCIQYTQKISVAISRMQSLTSVLRNKLPPEVIANSKEFELALASLIIMLSPVTPHFCSELWAGFLSAPNRINEKHRLINWEKNVIGQSWPVVDEDYELLFECNVDGIKKCDLTIKAKELANLTDEKALLLVANKKELTKRLSFGINKTVLDLYPGCRAILHIYTNNKVKVKQKQESVTQ